MQNTEFLTAFFAVYEAYMQSVYPFMALCVNMTENQQPENV
jgi:hypothetical protein